jgi:pimeloyl-ACP methyl ester carboxylesterase
MATAIEPTSSLPSIFEHFPHPATVGDPGVRARRVGMWAGLVAVSAGAGVISALGSRRRGLIAGAVGLAALGALRLQLARWFVETPRYTVERRENGLELRTYPLRIEARTQLEAHDFDTALDAGYGRLACYVYGANTTKEHLARTTPVTIAMHDGIFEAAFVMPPDRTITALPRPDDGRVDLREVPARRIAVLAFHGRFTRDNVESHERELLRRLVDAGLSARGSVTFACYDSPATIPALRRNELWIEVI